MPQDYKQAVAWYREAAAQGDAGAQANLGVMYANGEGVPQNYVQAYAWFSVAAANGENSVVKLRDRAAALLTPSLLAEGQALANRYFEQYRLRLN